jgi:hypothetical protein
VATDDETGEFTLEAAAMVAEEAVESKERRGACKTVDE